MYAVLQTNPPRLYSNLQYVQRWRNPLSLKSEAGCYFTHLQAAASFLDNLASEQSQRREGGGASPLAPLPPANAEADEDADEDDAASVAASSVAAAAAAARAGPHSRLCEAARRAGQAHTPGTPSALRPAHSK